MTAVAAVAAVAAAAAAAAAQSVPLYVRAGRPESKPRLGRSRACVCWTLPPQTKQKYENRPGVNSYDSHVRAVTHT